VNTEWRSTRRAGSRRLRDAILERDARAAADFIAAGVKVDPRDTEHGETDLMLAAQVGSVEIARLLLNRGADLEAVDRKAGAES
jgi:ankyrin repeat protein